MLGGTVFLIRRRPSGDIIAGDPESVAETWMSNVYSFGMVIWEMVSGEAAYAAYSLIQAAVGIAASGLRPEIPKDCPGVLRSPMSKCWNNSGPLFPGHIVDVGAVQQRDQLKVADD
ncbi:hypothetical protein MLD38_025188 [Melastoma candidum]|uniref:Uncharacterized protein n=1 Tax=Melastoma candidum TaxID=119954 RepID=A0ACB9P1H6_9MYRT|nr:hypothetical protein MLD38_025188 [Melastoma candidum]